MLTQDDDYEIGQVISGKKLGYKDGHNYVYAVCKLCGKNKFVRMLWGKQRDYICIGCAFKLSRGED